MVLGGRPVEGGMVRLLRGRWEAVPLVLAGPVLRTSPGECEIFSQSPGFLHLPCSTSLCPFPITYSGSPGSAKDVAARNVRVPDPTPEVVVCVLGTRTH